MKTKTKKTADPTARAVLIPEALHHQLAMVASARRTNVQALQAEIDAEWLDAHPVEVEVAKATKGSA